jgi:hypothetical protein
VGPEAAGHFLACAIEMMWSMRNSGTRNVGIKLSGNTVISAVETP